MAGKTRTSSFGYVQKRVGNSGARYTATFPNPEYGNHPSEKQRISKTFERKSAAGAWLAQQQALIERGVWKSPETIAKEEVEAAEREKILGRTFGDYASEWLGSGMHKSSVQRSYASAYRAHLSDKWAHTPLRDISTVEVEHWLHNELGQRMDAAGGVRVYVGARKKAFELFKAIMSAAVDAGYIEKSPCTKRMTSFVRVTNARKTDTDRHAPHALTAQEVRALADEVPENMRLLVLLLADRGLRIGEARELRRKDIDLTAGTITIARSVTNDGKDKHVDTPKTITSARTIRMGGWLVDLFREHFDAQGVHGKDALVFVSSVKADYQNGHMAQRTIQRNMERACKRLGIAHTSPHDLRHTCASLLLEKGHPLPAVMHLLGQNSLGITLIYTHATDREQWAMAQDSPLTGALDATNSVVSLDARRSGAV